MRPFVESWVPVILWAGVIFYFSSDQFSADHTSRIVSPLLHWLAPSISLEVEQSIHFTVRKLGHLTEYFLFAALLMRALRDLGDGKWDHRAAISSLVVIFLFACSDEFHQSFVPSRSASFGDSLLDSIGGFCGVIWSYWRHRGTISNETAKS